ncbi:MAG: OmpA family protein [Deltaproteobacteria bacterium]|nr:OmpA family protein [Deltaproteobacteria bacterium]
MRLILVCSLLLAGTAMAQSAQPIPEFRLERFSFNGGARDGLTAASGDVLDNGQLHVLLGFHYENEPLVLVSNDEREGALVARRLTAHLAVGYGLTSYLQVVGEIPLVLYQAGDSIDGVQSPDSAGLSSPLLNARLALTSQRSGGLLAREFPLDVAIQLGAVIPLSTGRTLSREFGMVPQISLGRNLGQFRVGGEMAVWIRPENMVLTPGGTVRDSVGSQLGLKLIGSTRVKDVGLELSGHAGFPLGGGDTPLGVEALAGVRFPVWMLELFAIGGPGFGQLPGTPSFRVLAGVALAPAKPVACVPGESHSPAQCPDLDDDGDGLLNRVDRCPLEKEDADSFRDEDGCPDPDNDADKVLDVDDKCPNVPGPVEEQGCPVVDSDLDGLPDKVDACPQEPGLKERKGCPIRDADKDGIEDADDACPQEPGPKERKGCPIRDADKDGIEDADDACPKEPGKAELKGCPDRDGDTVVDNRDNCPDEKGDPDNQGCPKAKKQLVEITREKLVIKDKIFFATAKATILPKSFPLLNQVADVLKGHGEISSVAIEGHTDNVGKRDYNLKLSQARAESVRAYLIKRGVDGNRLKAAGYGPDRPAGPNLTEASRANNRRVEFMIESAEKVEIKAKEVP